MFERLFQTAKKREESLEEERLAVENGIEDVRIALTAVAPPDDESHYAERGLAAGFDSFEEIYRRAMGEKSRDRYSVLTVVGMMDSAHLAGMSVESKRSSVMMALEAAGVPPSQILQDAMVRQSALDDYVDTQEKKLRAFESAMNDANRRSALTPKRLPKNRMRFANGRLVSAGNRKAWRPRRPSSPSPAERTGSAWAWNPT